MSQHIGVLGGGEFGRALATAAARTGARVDLWSRRADVVAIEGVHTTADLGALAQAELVFVAVPSTLLHDLAREFGSHLDGRHYLVHVSRGLVGDNLETLSQVLRRTTPCRRVGALAGPLVATALAAGAPTGCIVGTRFPEVARAVRAALSGPMLRVYSTDDVLGVEVASAMVGLLALAVGYARGLGLGAAPLAVMSTRGLAEASRVGVALGAAEGTFHGLAGTGDLLAAVADDDRPELRLGRALARGANLETAGREVGANIEGVSIARQVASFGERLGLETPIAGAVAAVIDGRIRPDQAIETLMARPASRE